MKQRGTGTGLVCSSRVSEQGASRQRTRILSHRAVPRVSAHRHFAAHVSGVAKTWPVIRHIRWAYLLWSLNYYWLTCGPGRWCPPTAAEAAYLEAVWKGER
jgi:hypothetical protein